MASGTAHQPGGQPGRRLLVVANRLPVNVSLHENGEVEMQMASGGLVTALHALSRSMEFYWFGWPGVDIHRNDRAEVKKQLGDKFNAVPIFLNPETAERHYNGFSNSILWPLLHDLPFRAQFDERWSDAYYKVNQQIADTIAPHVRDTDLIWIHDYHLMLLPRLLRDRLSGRTDVRIGFFLHTPFPEKDMFDILPLRKSICNGLLSCDLVGFHTREYVDNFVDCASQDLLAPEGSSYQEMQQKAQTFPLGIDPETYKTSLESEETQAQASRLQQVFQGNELMVGVDRLDYTKGILQKLHAFNKMLVDHPEWTGKVVLVQVCVPTRSGVESYQELRREVEELVGRINGTHGTLAWTPIQYLYTSLDKSTLNALLSIASVCIVSPVRDGLNLVSYEYVACQPRFRGVLVLSQYAGAAKTLGSVLQFNPWDIPRFAATISQALSMPVAERRTRMEEAHKAVNHWTSMRWGSSFLRALESAQVAKGS